MWGAGADSPLPQPLLNSTNLQKTEIRQSLLYRGPVDPANWFGVRKGFPNLGYVQVSQGPQGHGAGGWGSRVERDPSPPPQNHLQVLLLLVFEAIVYRRQEHHRRQHQLGPLPAQAVCADGTRQRLDQDLLGCFKYFVNFFFYKFGLEVRLCQPSPPLRAGPGAHGALSVGFAGHLQGADPLGPLGVGGGHRGRTSQRPDLSSQSKGWASGASAGRCVRRLQWAWDLLSRASSPPLSGPAWWRWDLH